jgi:uncharacterized membrane protein YfcA
VFGIESVFGSPWELVAVCLVLVAAEALYVLLGFGAGLVAVGALALVMPEIRDVVVLLLLVNLPAEMWVVATSWRTIAWRGVASLMIGIAVGVPFGAWFLGRGDPRILFTTLGAILFFVGSVVFLWPTARVRRWPRWVVIPVGVSSGVLTGLFGTGGPPLVLYYRLLGMDKTRFRGNLMAIFLLMTVVRVPAYAGMGLITLERLWSGLMVLPAVAVGAWFGHRFHLQVAENVFRRLVAAALIALSVALVVGGP